MSIGERLQYYRKCAGLSQEELGQKLFVSRQTVSQWEMNKTLPTIDNLILLKTIFGISAEDILSDNNTVESLKTEPKEKYEYAYSKSELHDINKLSILSNIKKAIGFFIIITLSFIFLVGTGAENMLIGIIIGIFIFGIVLYTGLFIRSAKAYRNNAAYMNGRSYSYEIFDEYLLLTISKSGAFTKLIRVDYKDIDTVTVTGRFLVITYDGQLYLFKKDTLTEDSVLYSIYRNHTGNKPVKPFESKYRIISLVLFILSILSVLGALICTGISTYGNDFTECMWIFLLFTPLPLASTVFGFLMKSKGLKYKKNVIVGIIMTALLCIYGSFTFIFNDIYTHSDALILKVEEQVGIDIPDYEKATTQDWTKGTQSISRGYIYSTGDVYFDETVADGFEEQIAADNKWLTTVPNDLIGITSVFIDLNGYDYYIILNADTGEFNTLPEKSDTYKFYNLLFSSQNNCLKIIEYEMDYTK